jgi:hypothetical protein
VQGASSWGVGWGVGGSRLLFTQMQTCDWMRDWLVNESRQRKLHETQRADRSYDARGLRRYCASFTGASVCQPPKVEQTAACMALAPRAAPCRPAIR